VLLANGGFVAVCTAGLLVVSTAPPMSGDVAVVKQAGSAVDAAFAARDVAALSRLMAEDYRSVSPNGVRLVRATVVADLKTGRAQRDSIKREDVEIRIYGTTAVEIGRMTVSGKVDGKPFDGEFIYTMAWIQKDGRWLLASEHYCHSPKR
jgi:ketosteroid isomerase-like protein